MTKPKGHAPAANHPWLNDGAAVKVDQMRNATIDERATVAMMERRRIVAEQFPEPVPPGTVRDWVLRVMFEPSGDWANA